MDNKQNTIFRLVQDYLKPCPVIIWGSGATIPFGMPSMGNLKQELKITDDGNLEQILSSIKNEEYDDYKEKIFNIINEKDNSFRNKINDNTFKDVRDIIRYFYNSHPKNLNIITTNYDCFLEYLLAYEDYPFSDGFSGREQSKFDTRNFKTKDWINILKVHGSLRWCDDRYSHYNTNMQAILPSKNKYQESTQEPFRTLITKSDSIISESNSFLVIGFGFNDDHLTPKIDNAIKNGGAIVIVTKTATENTKSKIKKAKKFILIESSDNEETKFYYKENNRIKTHVMDGEFWKLEHFKNILV